MMYGYGWWAPVGLVFMIGLVALAVWLIAAAARLEPAGASGTKGLAELADRFARGEIDSEEYRNRRSIIEGSI